MIVDVELCNQLKPFSAKKVLCSCDICGKEQLLAKSAITKGHYKICNACSYAKLRKEGRLYKSKFTKNDTFFSVPNLINCYWAGFIAADGNISPRKSGKTNTIYVLKIVLQERDIVLLEQLSSDCLYNGTIKNSYVKSKRYPYIEFNNLWNNDLNKIYSITPNKSLTLLPPNITDLELSMAYIKGYIDGDGYIGNNGHCTTIEILGTNEVLTWIKTIFDQYFLPSKGQVAKVKSIKHSKAFRYMNKLIPTHGLDRKWYKNLGSHK